MYWHRRSLESRHRQVHLSGGTQITITGTDFGPRGCNRWRYQLSEHLAAVAKSDSMCPPLGPLAHKMLWLTRPGNDGKPGHLHLLGCSDVGRYLTLVGSSRRRNADLADGHELPGGATVSVGGSPCLNVSVLNDTTITCDTPAGTSGDVGSLSLRLAEPRVLKRSPTRICQQLRRSRLRQVPLLAAPRSPSPVPTSMA